MQSEPSQSSVGTDAKELLEILSNIQSADLFNEIDRRFTDFVDIKCVPTGTGDSVVVFKPRQLLLDRVATLRAAQRDRRIA
jgi:hypothetical protein